MSGSVECFYPGSSFPAISVTGKACALNCKHCSRKYLEGMVPATKPEDLLQIADALAQRGAMGFLLSGGSDDLGKIPLSPFVPAIRTIKTTTDLRVNAHVGLAPRTELEELVGSGVDAFSIDLYGDDATVQDVLGLNAKADDYFRVLSDLRDLGASKVAPHICVGIHGGKLGGEFKAIERLASAPPDMLILISLIPTRGSAYEKASVPDASVVRSVIEKARSAMPETRLLLGCMRSKLDRGSEYDFVKAGLDGIVLPSVMTVERLRSDGYRIKKSATCCALL